jgi:ferredoxin
MTARLVVDTDKCAGHGRCYMIASDLFDADDAGYPIVLHEVVPDERTAEARDAVDNCPERAISLT